MAAPEEFYREFVTRTNRTMAVYLAMVAWTQRLDCVAIDRDEILRYWGLTTRVEDQRIDWLKSDVNQFFPHVEALFEDGRNKFGSVYLARREFPEPFANLMNTKARAKVLTSKGFPTAVVPLPTEAEMLTQLTVLIHGLRDLPPPVSRNA